MPPAQVLTRLMGLIRTELGNVVPDLAPTICRPPYNKARRRAWICSTEVTAKTHLAIAASVMPYHSVTAKGPSVLIWWRCRAD